MESNTTLVKFFLFFISLFFFKCKEPKKDHLNNMLNSVDCLELFYGYDIYQRNSSYIINNGTYKIIYGSKKKFRYLKLINDTYVELNNRTELNLLIDFEKLIECYKSIDVEYVNGCFHNYKIGIVEIKMSDGQFVYYFDKNFNHVFFDKKKISHGSFFVSDKSIFIDPSWNTPDGTSL